MAFPSRPACPLDPAQVDHSVDIRSSTVPTHRLNQTRPNPAHRRSALYFNLSQSHPKSQSPLSAKMRITLQHLLDNAPEGIASAQEQLAKSRHLLRSVKRNHLGRNRPTHPPCHCPKISEDQEQPPKYQGLRLHLKDSAQDMPQRVSTYVVVLFTMSKPCHQWVPVSGTHFPMVKARLLQERPRLPALHPGGCDRDPINTPASDWSITANFFKALAPEHLAGA